MKKLLALTLLAGLALPLAAAEESKKKPVQDDKKSSEKAPQKKAETTDKKKPDDEEKPGVFKPSEELSEDYSVPFPTDI